MDEFYNMRDEISWLEHTVHTRSVSSSNLLIATFGRHIRYEYVFFSAKNHDKRENHVIIKTKKGEQEYACRNGI